MNAALTRMHRRQQRQLDTLERNDRIRSLALAGADAGNIKSAVNRGENYVRRIAGWRLK